MDRLVPALACLALAAAAAVGDGLCAAEEQCLGDRGSGVSLLQLAANVSTASSNAARLRLAGSTEAKETPLTSGNYTEAKETLTSGNYTLDGHYYEAVVPSGSGPFPVLILIPVRLFEHGHGQTGYHHAMEFKDELLPMSDRFVLIVPHVPQDVDEKTPVFESEDVAFLGGALVDGVALFSNVEPRFVMCSHSSGSILGNRILIENDDPRIVGGVFSGSQLTTRHYNNGSFHVGAMLPPYDDELSFSSTELPDAHRRIFQMTGTADEVVPAEGGQSQSFDGDHTWLHWEESAYRWAQGWGYAETPVPADETDEFFNVSYLGGRVQAYNYKGVEHDFHLTDQVVNFLNGF